MWQKLITIIKRKEERSGTHNLQVSRKYDVEDIVIENVKIYSAIEQHAWSWIFIYNHLVKLKFLNGNVLSSSSFWKPEHKLLAKGGGRYLPHHTPWVVHIKQFQLLILVGLFA